MREEEYGNNTNNMQCCGEPLVERATKKYCNDDRF